MTDFSTGSVSCNSLADFNNMKKTAAPHPPPTLAEWRESGAIREHRQRARDPASLEVSDLCSRAVREACLTGPARASPLSPLFKRAP